MVFLVSQNDVVNGIGKMSQGNEFCSPEAGVIACFLLNTVTPRGLRAASELDFGSAF